MAVLVYALDVSISMAKSYSDFVPNKLEASIGALAVSAKRAVEAGYKVGLVVFAEWAVPLVYPSRRIQNLLAGLRVLGKTFIGSAPGDAIVESVKIMRNLPDQEKLVALVTDGDYNMGVPIEYAFTYAEQAGVKIGFFVIGEIQASQLSQVYSKYRDSAMWVEARVHDDLVSSLTSLVGGENK